MKFEQIKEILTAEAIRAGLTDYEIYYQTGKSLSADALKDEISSFSSSAEGGVCFRCIRNGKTGYASTELLAEERLKALVGEAISNADAVTSEDETFLFAGSPVYAKIEQKELSFPSAADLRHEVLDLQRQIYAASPRVGDGTQSGIAYYSEEIHLSNSKGLSLSNTMQVGLRYAEALVREGEEAESGFAFAEVGHPEECREVAGKAVRIAESRLGAVTIPSGKYPVVFDGKAFKDFLSTFSAAFSAKSAQKGLSRLAGKEGEKIASPIVTIVDDPMREDSPIKANFDGEGVATARREVVKDGVLTTLLYDLSTAKIAGRESTGHGQKHSYAAPVSIAPYQFSIKAGASKREDLFRAAGNGIFVTGCKGFHAGADPVTGDFSMESYGFLIKDGKQAGPVKSFTVSGNFFELLFGIEGLGDTVAWGIPSGATAFGSPDVYLPSMSVAGE